MNRSLLSASLLAGLLASGNSTGIAGEVPDLPASGTTHFTTYFSVRTAHELAMVDDASMTTAELVGITRNPEGSPTSTTW
jgi:hypothetical protein